MGNLLNSGQNLRVEEIDVASNHAYKYPPRSGNYFGSQFIMGGDRFDTPQPEAYLFGENSDLNFLGHRPTPFPYPPPPSNEPTKTLRSLVNIRKESVRFVRVSDEVLPEQFGEEPHDSKFNLEFVFDADVSCTITVSYFCTEEINNSGVTYTSKTPSMTSESYHYKSGANQLFSQPLLIFDPSKFSEEDLLYDFDKEIIPVVIHCVVEDGLEGESKQSHTTFCVVDRHTDGTYVLRALKQKLFVDGLSYLLQEIYGIENKNNEKSVADEDTEENGAECVICMCDVRDTLILPCKHLCLCNSCADSLRYQANNCPICRAPFRALLQIRALQKNPMYTGSSPPSASEENDQIPPGYEAVSLVEALNGPYTARQPNANLELTESPDSEATVQAAEVLNRQSTLEEEKCNSQKDGNSPEYRLSVLPSREDSTTRKHSKMEKSAFLSKNTDEDREEEKVATEHDQSVDVDSDAEKLSPLLVVKTRHSEDDVTKPSPDSDKRKTPPDDSDYYTPDDPHPNALYEGPKDGISVSVESTPDRQSTVISLPGTPLSQISQVSARSSGDSYSSTSSTKLLITHNTLPNSGSTSGITTTNVVRAVPTNKTIIKDS